MNIEDMTDQEKSVMLARAMGWEVLPAGHIFPPEGPGHVAIHPESSLYHVNEMALAWRVLNWVDEMEDKGLITTFNDWWHKYHWYAEPPEVAQREWLDKILSLAIEAGIVEPVESS